MKRLLAILLMIAVAFSAIGLVAAQTADPTEEPDTEAGAETEYEKEVRPYLGVRFGPNEDGPGVVIAEVVMDSPAHEAGLEAGDVVTAVNGEDLGSGDLAGVIASLAPGDVVTLTIERDGEAQDIDITLGTAPETFFRRGQDRRQDRRQDRHQNRRDGRGNNFDYQFEFSDRPFLGVSLANEDEGVVVTSVVADSPAEAAGIETGDVITAVDGEDVADAQAVVDAIAALEIGDEVTVTIERDGESQDIIATLEEGALHQFFPELDGLEGFRGGRIFTIPGMPNLSNLRGTSLHIAPLMLGVEGDVLNETTAKEFNVPQQQGFYITRVLTDSTAAEAGLLAGDVITAINDTPLTEDLAMRDLMAAIAGEETVTVEVDRDGETLTLIIRLPSVIMPGFPDLPPVPDAPMQPEKDTDDTATTDA